MTVSHLSTAPSPSSTRAHSTKHDFSSPAFTVNVSALLIDMDGTIIDSTNAIVKFWERIGNEYGIDPDVILATSHGRRSIDVLKLIDPKRATWENVRQLEGNIPYAFGSDAVEVPGARSLLAQLDQVKAPWAIVTSGTRPLVEGWLRILNLGEPRCLVTAEDVENGKPNPACYLLGRKRLGLRSSSTALVFEDAPAGVRAGKAAGFRVVALATTHRVEELIEAGADWIVRDMRSVSIEKFDGVRGEISVELSSTLCC